jgi:CheY-like chemotaxis protein
MHRASDNDLRFESAHSSALPVDFKPLDLSGVTVLIVDDEPDARLLLERVLSDCNADVLVAATGETALPVIEQRRPHVLVSDIGMPGIDGYEPLRRVRALGKARGGRLPAIALTAFARSEDRARALRAGFQVQVSKPVEPSELVATWRASSGARATWREQRSQRGHAMKMGVWIALGVGIGTAIGVAMNQTAMGVALGAAFGTALGAAFGGKRR